MKKKKKHFSDQCCNVNFHIFVCVCFCGVAYFNSEKEIANSFVYLYECVNKYFIYINIEMRMTWPYYYFFPVFRGQHTIKQHNV